MRRIPRYFRQFNTGCFGETNVGIAAASQPKPYYSASDRTRLIFSTPSTKQAKHLQAVRDAKMGECEGMKAKRALECLTMVADDDTEEGSWRGLEGLSVPAAVHWDGFVTDNENEVGCESTDFEGNEGSVGMFLK